MLHCELLILLPFHKLSSNYSYYSTEQHQPRKLQRYNIIIIYPTILSISRSLLIFVHPDVVAASTLNENMLTIGNNQIKLLTFLFYGGCHPRLVAGAMYLKLTGQCPEECYHSGAKNQATDSG